VARGIEVGIDVELAAKAFAGLDVARQFFTAREAVELGELTPAARPLAFLRCWTRKEAYIKARGEGLQTPLDTFAVTLREEDPAELSWHATAGEAVRWTLVDLSDPDRGIAGALCHEAGATTSVRWIGPA
jgi:4'-phosphopantetheinyl transferase